MEWKGTKYELPQETGRYIVSLRQQFPLGVVFSNYSAHYEADSQKWYKYDPFVEKYEPTEEITDLVVGWVSNSSAYLV